MRNGFQFALYPLLGLGIVLSVLILAMWNQRREQKPLQVGEMQEYRDPGVGFSTQYPKGWIANAQVGRAYFYDDHGVEMVGKHQGAKFPYVASFDAYTMVFDASLRSFQIPEPHERGIYSF